MSSRCSICRHPQRELIDVSLVRDGIRFTARQFQVSRPSLDRHKRHHSQAVAYQDREVAASIEGTTPLLSQLEVMIGHCKSAISQAQANRNFVGAMRATRELRSHFELKCKLEFEERKHRGLLKDRLEQKSRASDGPQVPLGDIDEKVEALTLRVRIRLATNLLGETARSLSPPILNISGNNSRHSVRDSSSASC